MHVCMHECTHIYIHIHTHKTFFCAIRKFYFVNKEKARNYHSSERGSSVTRRSCIAIATCNKQLPARQATSLAAASRRALALASRPSLLRFLINNSLTIAKLAKWYKTFLFSFTSSMSPTFF